MLKILVTDDSATMRQIVKTFLQSAGHEVCCAENGQIAFDKAMAQHYDLVVTDIDMPVMNGLDLAGKLRRSPQHQHTPILMMTGGTTEKSEAIKFGISGWLRKPFAREALLSAVTSATNPSTVIA